MFQIHAKLGLGQGCQISGRFSLFYTDTLYETSLCKYEIPLFFQAECRDAVDGIRIVDDVMLDPLS